MLPPTSPSTTTKTATTTTTKTPPRPVSPGYRLLTPSELSKILNQPPTHLNHTTTNIIPTLPVASSSSNPISSLHHHHLQPPTDVYHAPKPLIPSSSSSSMILGHGIDHQEQQLTPGLSTPTEGDLGKGMNDIGSSESSIHDVELKSKSNTTSNSRGDSGQTSQPQSDGLLKPVVATPTPATATTSSSVSAAAAAVGNESSRTLCVRHQSMADQGINGKLQQVRWESR